MCRVRRRVDAWCRDIGSLQFDDHFNIAVVTVLVEQDAVPIANNARTGVVIVRVCLGQAVGLKTRADFIVAQGSQDHWKARLPDDMQHATNSIVDIQQRTRRSEAGVAGQFHHQTFRRTTLQTQATKRVDIGHVDDVPHNMDHVRVVPDTLRSQCFAANLHSVNATGGRRVARRARQPVAADERSAVVDECCDLVDVTSGTTIVRQFGVVQRVGVDADRRAIIVADDVVDNNRLRGTDKNRRTRVAQPPKSIRWCRTARASIIPLQDRICNPCLCLMNLDSVEARKVTFQRYDAATIGNQCVIDAGAAGMTDVQTTPQTAAQSKRRFGVIIAVAAIVVRVKRAARTIAIVQPRGEDNLLTVLSFG